MSEKNKLLSVLKEYYDQIYILSLVNRKDRRESIEKQFEALGLPKPDTTPFIRYYYATPFPYNDIIANTFNVTKKGMFTKPNEYDCARNHYSIVKICYELGYHRCLIIEDDVLFLKNKEEIIEYLEVLGDGGDVVQFGGFTTDPRITKWISNKKALWTSHDDTGVWNCSMYALSRKGMEYYLAFMDKIFWVADGPVYKAPLNNKIITTLISNKPIVIQADKDIVSSDIRDENNDDIDYKTQNIYEKNINKSDYFEYN